jgi:hypothetical protein
METTNHQNPKIAFCITCKGRTHHLRKTLTQNLADNIDYENAVFIVLDYSSTDDLQEYLKTNHQSELDSGRVILYHYREAERFNMTHAKNMAHRCGIREGANILCNLDADNYTGLGFASYIALTIKTSWDYLAVDKVIPGVTPRGVTGRIVVHKDAFIKAGGYDEKFETWSPDDKDFNHRLQRMGYTQHIIPAQFLNCIKHSDKVRFREYPELHHMMQHDYECVIQNEIAVKIAIHTVVNFGIFGCGIVFRNFIEIEIKIDIIPTRIFGIGMHKTGTTSLHQALSILGYDSGHWDTPRWAKRIWEEMKGDKHSRTIENHYAVCDLPIPLLYKELDETYVGSKFILTIREDVDWLASVRDHWNPRHNKWRETWDNDCFTHRVHNLIYGRKSFDATVFLERYRRHNAEVIEHFKDRPENLLVLSLEDKDPWKKICNFLGHDIPEQPYPMANKKYKR